MHWIIGDVHGMLTPLEKLLAHIARADPAAVLCFAGDYINRGPDSRHVVDLLLALPNALFIRGNHDDVFDLIVNGDSYCESVAGGDRLLAFRWFMEHGLEQTLLSYGVTPESLAWAMRVKRLRHLEEIVEHVPAAHRAFFRDLPGVIEKPGFFVGHGRWDVRDSVDQAVLSGQLATQARVRSTLIWGRFSLSEILAEKAWSRVGYFGHTPVENYPALLPGGRMRPVRGPRMVLLDTAAALRSDGTLTAWCHESGEFAQADRSGAVRVSM